METSMEEDTTEQHDHEFEFKIYEQRSLQPAQQPWLWPTVWVAASAFECTHQPSISFLSIPCNHSSFLTCITLPAQAQIRNNPSPATEHTVSGTGRFVQSNQPDLFHHDAVVESVACAFPSRLTNKNAIPHMNLSSMVVHLH